VARQEVEVARLNRKPNWSYEVSYGQRVGRPDLMSFGVSIPLPVAPGARQDRETAAKLALVEKAEADAEEARRAAAGEYAALSSDARRLQARIERFQTAVLEPLKQRTAATLAAYRANQASLVMLFEARHAEVEAQRKVLNLQRDLAKTQAQLVFKPIPKEQCNEPRPTLCRGPGCCSRHWRRRLLPGPQQRCLAWRAAGRGTCCGCIRLR
jgi:outer membrane protein TolC